MCPVLGWCWQFTPPRDVVRGKGPEDLRGGSCLGSVALVGALEVAELQLSVEAFERAKEIMRQPL